MLRPARNRARPAAPFTRATPPEGLPAGERRSKPRGVRTLEHDSAVKKGAALNAPRKRPAERMKSDPAGPVLCESAGGASALSRSVETGSRQGVASTRGAGGKGRAGGQGVAA